jgi:hypothetical protein
MNGDEPDRKDETLVAYDRQVVDDELNAIWPLFPSGARIFMLSDSCNSGTNYKMMPDVLETSTPMKMFSDVNAKAAPMNAKMIHFGGCRDGRTSIGYQTGGVFTQAVCNIYANGAFTGDYKSFYDKVRAAAQTTQDPQFNKYGPVDDAFLREKPFSIDNVVRARINLVVTGDNLDAAREALDVRIGKKAVPMLGAELRMGGSPPQISVSGTAGNGGSWSVTGTVTVGGGRRQDEK